jgi:hypothetical protein
MNEQKIMDLQVFLLEGSEMDINGKECSGVNIATAKDGVWCSTIKIVNGISKDENGVVYHPLETLVHELTHNLINFMKVCQAEKPSQDEEVQHDEKFNRINDFLSKELIKPESLLDDAEFNEQY